MNIPEDCNFFETLSRVMALLDQEFCKQCQPVISKLEWITLGSLLGKINVHHYF